MFAFFVPLMIAMIWGANEFGATMYQQFMQTFGSFLTIGGDNPQTWRIIQAIWFVVRLLLWVLLIMIGIIMGATVVFACYTYKQIINELALRIPYLSLVLTAVFFWLNIKWAKEIAEYIRNFVPDNLHNVYDFVLRFALPAEMIFVGFVGFFVNFLTWSIRIQLHRGFWIYGDEFRNREYYEEWTDSSDVVPAPSVREQLSEIGKEFKRRWRKEPPVDADDDGQDSSPSMVAITQETLRAVFPKGGI